LGYDVHLTRKEFWADEEGPEISLAEWQAYVATDAEIQPDPDNSGPDNYLFVSHPEQWPLWWHSGEVYTKNPDALVIAKLLSIARALHARVLGDDDEIYGIDPANPMVAEPR
jgi:hypothetical protein